MDDIKKYSGAILTCLAALVLVIILCGVFWLLIKLVPNDVGSSLPLLAIGGVVVLIFMLTVVAMIFSALGLSNRDLAMGLPDGSIRAVIALSLIVLFAILSIFLFDNISKGGPFVKIDQMSAADRAEFIRSHTNARDITSVVSPGKTDVFDVSYRSGNAASEDFAKQLLVLLGTLMTAVTSFYLGAGTVTSAVKAGNEVAAAAASPDPKGINPKSHSIATNGAVLHLEITGTNLGAIKGVKISKAGADAIVGSKVDKNATRVTCDLDVSKAAPGVWEVEIEDGGSKVIKLTEKLTITA